MTNIFTAFLLTSLIGTAFAILIILIKPITRKVFSANWHYYIWLCVILVMMLPLRINLPETEQKTFFIETQPNEIIEIETNEITSVYDKVLEEEPSEIEPVLSIKNFVAENIELFSYIWLIGLILFLSTKIIAYIVFNVKIHKNSEICDCPKVSEYTKRKIKTRVSNKICSPLMVGIIRPTLILPKREMTEEQLHNILLHETTHLKRNDILYKWIVSIVKCIHWFNPVIYFIARQVNAECEISCDMAVIKKMSNTEEKSYIETILSLLTNNNKKTIPLTTGMAGDKNTLKKRFTMIKNKIKISRKVAIISGVLAIIILLTTLFTSGILNGVFLKTDKENQEVIFIEELGLTMILPDTWNDKYALEKTDNGEYEVYNPNIRRAFSEESEIPDVGGMLFYIMKWDEKLTETQAKENGEWNFAKNQYIMTTEEGTYFLYYASDIQFTKETEKEYRQMEKEISQIQFKVGMPVITNAENMTFEDMRGLQLSVDNGHFPWRLDPAQVISSFMSQKGKTVSRIRIPEIKTDKLDYEDGSFKISLFKPIDKTEKGIWVVKSYKEKNNIELSSVVWPVESKTISQSFGKRVHPITGEEKSHNGVDIKANENSPVISSISGKVADTGYDKEFGNFVVIEKNIGIKVFYGHLSEISVKKGESVNQRDIIGKVGKTGLATGVNLHFEVQMNGEYVNPERFLNAEKPARIVRTLGLELEFTPNSQWIQNIKCDEKNDRYSEIYYYDDMLRSDCKMMISKDEPLLLSDYDFNDVETWEATEKKVFITLKKSQKEKKAIAEWKYENYNFAIIGENVDFNNSSVSSIPKTAISLINSIKIVAEIEKPTEKVKLKTDKSSDNSAISLSHLTLRPKMNYENVEQMLKSSGLYHSDEQLSDLKNSYVTGECRGGTYSLVHNENVICDANGNITFYFYDSGKDYINITFTDRDTGNVVAEYGVLPDSSKSYSFMGFEKDKVYNVVMLPVTNNPEKKYKYIVF